MTTAAATATKAKVNAYYRGRNSVWNGFGPECDEATSELAAEYHRGRRSAFAEKRLDADTEWDTDEGY
jgi:hypothetical protein